MAEASILFLIRPITCSFFNHQPTRYNMYRFVLTGIIIFHLQRFADSSSLDCESLKREQEGNGTSQQHGYASELQEMDLNDLIACLATLGQSEIPQDQANNVWNSLKKYYPRIEDIPLECYKFMGFALIGIPVEDFQNITFDSIDLIEAFGKPHGLSPEQLSALVEGVFRDWSKVPSTLSEFDLMAMRQILCALNKTDISRIHPDSYKGAAQVIGELKGCPPEVNQAFAELAVQKSAFGPADQWTQTDLGIIGNVIDGLPPDAYANIPRLSKSKGKENAVAN